MDVVEQLSRDVGQLHGARILVVSPTPTWPQDYGNRKRIYSVCEQLKARGAHIHFVLYPVEGEWRDCVPLEARRALEQQWDAVDIVAPTGKPHPDAEGRYHAVDEWWDPGLGAHLEWLFAKSHFDVLLVNYTWLSKALDYAPPGVFRILDTHDRFSGRRELLEQHGIAPEFFYLEEADEKKALERADLVWAIKDEEREFFRELVDGPRVETLLHQESGREVRPPGEFPADKRYLRVGLLGARNNINLVNTRAFLDMALPMIREHMAPVQVVLAGTMCLDLQMSDSETVRVLGVLDDVEDFYDAVDVVAVPMTFSTGLKIKVGEALARGMPIVAHRHAFEGFPPTSPYHQLDSLEDVALACIDLSFDPAPCAELARASRESQSILSERVHASIDDALRMVVAESPSRVVIPPHNWFAGKGLDSAYFDERLHFLIKGEQVFVYLDEPIPESQLPRISRLCNVVRVVLGEGCDPEAVFAARPGLRNLVNVCSLEELVKAWNVKTITTTYPLPASRVAALTSAGAAIDEDDFCYSVGGHDAQHRSFEAFPWRPSRATRGLQGVWPGASSDSLFVHVFADEELLLKHGFKAFFESICPPGRSIVWVLPEPAPAVSSSLRDGDRLVPVADLVADPGMVERPRFAVNLLPEDRSSLAYLVQFYLSARIPCIQVSAGQVFPVSGNRVSSFHELVTNFSKLAVCGHEVVNQFE